MTWTHLPNVQCPSPKESRHSLLIVVLLLAVLSSGERLSWLPSSFFVVTFVTFLSLHSLTTVSYTYSFTVVLHYPPILFKSLLTQSSCDHTAFPVFLASFPPPLSGHMISLPISDRNVIERKRPLTYLQLLSSAWLQRYMLYMKASIVCASC